MQSKPLCKKVGMVDVYEFVGDFKGFQRGGLAKEFQSVEGRLNPKGILFNTRNLNQLDATGIEAILEMSRMTSKSAVITSDTKLYDQFRLKTHKERLHMFQSERVAAFYLAKEFVEGRSPEVVVSDKRRFPRLKAAIPLHFAFETESGEKAHFFAIVTNLSEVGCYAEFLGAREETELLQKLNEYDLKLLELNLHLNPTEVVRLSGKMVRMHGPRTGIAMEFYDSDDKELKHFKSWFDQEKLVEGVYDATKS